MCFHSSFAVFNISYTFQEDVFSLSLCPYYAYIDVKDITSSSCVRVKFQVDRSPLGFTFLRQCNDAVPYYAFRDTKICKPFKKSESIFFGSCQVPPPHHFPKVKLGNKNKYKQLLVKGAIGWYNNFNNEDFVTDHCIRVYINMDECLPVNEAIPYVRYDGLQFCFGRVIEGLDELESLLKNEDYTFIIKNCGVLVD